MTHNEVFNVVINLVLLMMMGVNVFILMVLAIVLGKVDIHEK